MATLSAATATTVVARATISKPNGLGTHGTSPVSHSLGFATRVK
jgi:hypothetical protein